MLRKEKIAWFDPFKMECFRCPVCGANEFVELVPHGGVWCEKCNANFTAKGTCDGLRKIAVSCSTEHTYKKFQEKGVAFFCGTVIWQEDKEISWLGRENGKVVTIKPPSP